MVPYKVLIVDDSSFFQLRLKELINEHPELKVVGVASNGQEAIEKEEELRPDIVSMDYEMPYLDGVSAVRAIMAKRRVPIVMFSSMTYEGATITLEALEAGAVDFVPKNFAEISRNSAELKAKLHEKLLAFARSSSPLAIREEREKRESLVQATQVHSENSKEKAFAQREKLVSKSNTQTSPSAVEKTINLKGKKLGSKVKIILIGASTGGPVALSKVITKLSTNISVPIVVIQHMPENFTRAFAERLNRSSSLSIKEAVSGDKLARGQVLIAPGGNQLLFDKSGKSVKVIPGDERVNYKPCIDVTFASAANVFDGKVLGIVMTGMGADGSEGARLLKQKGAYIWGQDKESCVVYGMPAVVAQANLVDEVIPLSQFSSRISEEF